jgi:hypothetical protein
MQVLTSAARAAVETRPAASRIVKAKTRVLTRWLSTFMRTAVSLLEYMVAGLAVDPVVSFQRRAKRPNPYLPDPG